jgi:hypothetical protein
MSADALCGTMVTVSETKESIAAAKYSPKRPTRSVAWGMGYSAGIATCGCSMGC